MINHGLDTNEQVFFYEQEFYPLSNFSAFKLKWSGQTFDTSEAAYQWEKFPIIGDLPIEILYQRQVIRDCIIEATSAHEAYKIAQTFKDYRVPNWDELKVGIMKRILMAKVEQHEYVRKKLLDTGTRDIIENSWRDDFWGWGQDKTGKNVLGMLWMEIREKLVQETSKYPQI